MSRPKNPIAEQPVIWNIYVKTEKGLEEGEEEEVAEICW